jgi:hypothetical protein
MTTTAGVVGWDTLANGTVLDADLIGKAVRNAAVGADRSFTQNVRYFDFEAYGRAFTQVALMLEPERPLAVDGRRVVLVTSEGGSDNGRAFIQDNAGSDGLGIWLARRGITLIQLCRLGRWNFLSGDPLGSWEDVPLGSRMPVFNRAQLSHWSADDYFTVDAEGVSSPTGSQHCRVPRPGSELEGYMLALVPRTSIAGFALAINSLVPAAARRDTLLLYYGFSTGGAYLWPLAKELPPDGIAGFGMSNFPISYYSSRAARGQFDWLYDRSASRLRERGTRDFEFFNRDLGEDERAKAWQRAARAPRFKSFEDTFMFFNVAALAETVSRLWNAEFLPERVRLRGFSALMQENLDLCFPSDALGTVRALDLYGTRDEVLTPDVARCAETVVGPYCGRYRMAFLDGYHHSIAADHAEAFGSLWLDAIGSGYYSPG